MTKYYQTKTLYIDYIKIFYKSIIKRQKQKLIQKEDNMNKDIGKKIDILILRHYQLKCLRTIEMLHVLSLLIPLHI